MPIPQRGIALASPCAHGGRIVRLEPGQLSGWHRAKAVLTTPRNPPLGLRTKHKGVSALLGRFFSVTADRRRWQPRTLRCN